MNIPFRLPSSDHHVIIIHVLIDKIRQFYLSFKCHPKNLVTNSSCMVSVNFFHYKKPRSDGLDKFYCKWFQSSSVVS